MITNIINPPIAWRFFIVYLRLVDGRVMYFRGQRRRALFIVNDSSDWVWVTEKARLFELDTPLIDCDASYAKKMQNHPLRKRINYQGFNQRVLASHLVIPAKVR